MSGEEEHHHSSTNFLPEQTITTRKELRKMNSTNLPSDVYQHIIEETRAANASEIEALRLRIQKIASAMDVTLSTDAFIRPELQRISSAFFSQLFQELLEILFYKPALETARARALS